MARSIKLWLLLGLVLVFFQIFIGGITRLTGSGLSITRWDIVTGTIPPLNNAEWEEAFALYRATPQYQKINDGMSMSEFKFIYFWEYFHRLWARMMGFVFLIPFLFFLSRGWISGRMMRKLFVLIGLALIVAIFGWIMVASGLVDRPWVSAYKLTWHLGLALIVYGYLAWLVFEAWYPDLVLDRRWRRPMLIVFGILVVQILLGGIMSGSKAGIDFPTWPDMRGEWLPSVLLKKENWNAENFLAYDSHLFFPALVQFCHRMTAYLLLIFGYWTGYKMLKTRNTVLRRSSLIFVALLTLQVVLGIFTVLACRGRIPVGLGIAHQSTAIFLLTAVLWLLYLVRKAKK